MLNAVVATEDIAIGAPTLFETAMVLVAKEGVGGHLILSRFLRDHGIRAIPFDDHHQKVALKAFLSYGKGRHPAKLNYGDCMTYATAKVANAPLLFVGDDFAKTDLTIA